MAALVVVIVLSAVASQPLLRSKATSQTADQTGRPAPGSLSAVSQTLIYSPSVPVNADFHASGVSISEPATCAHLVQYTLGLINSDRNSSGVPEVTLSTVLSGQRHADSLVYYGTFGHWDVQGYKPYMRYSLLGGGGSVEENVDLDYCTYSPPSSNGVFPTGCNLHTIENGIANAEAALMHRDVACCNNGHRDNILDAFHNSVSIGIAYNSTTDVRDLGGGFREQLHQAPSRFQVSGTTVTLQGTTQQDLTGWTGSSSGALMVVYYDPTPVAISASELTISPTCLQYSELYEPAYCQYRGAYGPGTEVTEVFAPCPLGYKCAPTQYSFAQQWTQSSSGSFKIVFSMASFEAEHGSGVYTLYLHPNGVTNQTITSLSVFVPGT